MKKHVLIELVLIVVIFGISFWNVKQQQEIVSLRNAIVVLDEDKIELQVKEEEWTNKNNQLTKQLAAASKSLGEFQDQNKISGADTDANIEFINIVTKLFEANLNFTPENYEDRKQEVSCYLSDDLKKEYFGNNRETYQDANGTTSKLESLEVYFKGEQNDVLEGLGIVQHKNKLSGQDWVKEMNIFKVLYNIKLKKIVKIINFGRGNYPYS